MEYCEFLVRTRIRNNHNRIERWSVSKMWNTDRWGINTITGYCESTIISVFGLSGWSKMHSNSFTKSYTIENNWRVSAHRSSNWNRNIKASR